MSAAENSVRADLEAAFKAQAEPVETEVAEKPIAEVASVIETKPTNAEERARDEKGRFAAKDAGSPRVADESGSAPAKPDAGPKLAGAIPETSTKESPRAEEAAAPSLAPPNGWSAEAKAKWHELPAEIMAAVQKREQDVTKFTSTRDEHASFGKEIYGVVQPYLATIRAEGGTPASAVQAMLSTAYTLRTGTPEAKRDVLLKVAREYGVDLGTAQAQPTGQQPTGLETLQQRIDRLEREHQEARLVTDSERAAAHQRLQSEVDTEIQAFAADPKHTHYETVKGHMAALIGQGAAKDLQDAYEQAVWARPDTRATLLAQQRAEEEQKRRADAKQKAEDARRKSVSITGGPGNTANSSAPEGRSIRDELSAAIAASSGAV